MRRVAGCLFLAAIALSSCGSDSKSAGPSPTSVVVTTAVTAVTVIDTTVAPADSAVNTTVVGTTEVGGTATTGSMDYSDDTPGLTIEQIGDDTLSIVDSYDINGVDLEDGIDGPPSADALATFAIYTSLIPAQYRVGVIAFVAIDQAKSDGTDGALQEVIGPDGNSTGDRYLALDVTGSSSELERTIVHETGHYLFLTPRGVPTSYADAFNAEFPPGGLYLPENFVSEYAASVLDGQEDIAESWAMFVLADTDYAGDADDDGNLDVVTPGTLAAEKVAFFEDYPELVQLKADILVAV